MRHPRLRLYVMHAGWPMLDDTLALLWAHPRVHVSIETAAFLTDAQRRAILYDNAARFPRLTDTQRTRRRQPAAARRSQRQGEPHS